MNQVNPLRLVPGDRVAIVAPSSPFDPEELLDGIDTISSMGLRPVLGPNVKNLKSQQIYAATVQDRVEELMWAFSAPNIRGIICATGGFGCAELLPYLDYSIIKNSEKVFITISDGTALNNGIFSRSGLINFNAQTPAIRLEKGEKAYHSDVESLEHVIKLCMSSDRWGDRPFLINDILPRTVVGGFASGKAIGGNLDTFCCLVGTNFLPATKNNVLFVEDVHKGSVTIARLLLHLKLSKILDSVAGIVVGEFAEIPEKLDMRSPSIDSVVLDYCGQLKIPVIYGLSFSHGNHTCPIPIGAETLLDSSGRIVEFDFYMGKR